MPVLHSIEPLKTVEIMYDQKEYMVRFTYMDGPYEKTSEISREPLPEKGNLTSLEVLIHALSRENSKEGFPELDDNFAILVHQVKDVEKCSLDPYDDIY